MTILTADEVREAQGQTRAKLQKIEQRKEFFEALAGTAIIGVLAIAVFVIL